MLSFDEISFVAVSVLIISDLLLIILSKKLIHTIIFLFFFLLMIASLFILLNSVFLAIAELFIYNGGIVILLTLGASIAPDDLENLRLKWFILLIPIAILVLLLIFTLRYNLSNVSQFSYQSLGASILGSYSFLLVLIAIISIASALSAIYLLSKEDSV